MLYKYISNYSRHVKLWQVFDEENGTKVKYKRNTYIGKTTKLMCLMPLKKAKQQENHIHCTRDMNKAQNEHWDNSFAIWLLELTVQNGVIWLNSTSVVMIRGKQNASTLSMRFVWSDRLAHWQSVGLWIKRPGFNSWAVQNCDWLWNHFYGHFALYHCLICT